MIDDKLHSHVEPQAALQEERAGARKGQRVLPAGKIARLPKTIREKLNRRLDNGEPASDIVPWLNGLPAVKKILTAQFGGKPITHKNLSNWRLNGYQRWLEKQESLASLRELMDEAKELQHDTDDSLAQATVTLASARLFKLFHSTPPDQSRGPGQDGFCGYGAAQRPAKLRPPPVRERAAAAEG